MSGSSWPPARSRWPVTGCCRWTRSGPRSTRRDTRWRAWVVDRRRVGLGALAAVLLLLLGWGGWLLIRAPVPAASAPPTVGGNGEAVPHTHVGMPGMAGASGAVVPVGGL